MTEAGRAPGTGGVPEVVRLGIVGAGFIAGRHQRAIERVGGAVIAGVADRDPARSQALAAATGGQACPDPEALLADVPLDALLICSPPGERGPAERLACEAGLPFLCEKPMAADEATAQVIADDAERHGVLAAVGYHWRFLDGMDRARELLAGTSPSLAEAVWLDQRPTTPWWPWRAGSGGQIVEQATHVLDALRLLVGEVDVVAARGVRGARHEDDGDVFDATVALLRGVDQPVVATAAGSSLLPGRHRTAVEVVAEGLVVEVSEQELRVATPGAPRWAEPEQSDAVARQDAAFLAAVRGDGPGRLALVADAVRSHQLACRIEQAAVEAGSETGGDGG